MSIVFLKRQRFAMIPLNFSLEIQMLFVTNVEIH